MAANLTGLFGSVRDQNEGVDGSDAPTTPAPLSGESGGGTAVVPSSSTSTAVDLVTTVVYLSEVKDLENCLGLIGTITANKFCLAHNCNIQKHQASKFTYQPGLYIRVPRRTDQAYCQPILKESTFETDLAADLLTEEKTVSEWATTFAQITAAGSKLNSGQWKIKDAVRQEAQAIKTKENRTRI